MESQKLLVALDEIIDLLNEMSGNIIENTQVLDRLATVLEERESE